MCSVPQGAGLSIPGNGLARQDERLVRGGGRLYGGGSWELTTNSNIKVECLVSVGVST